MHREHRAPRVARRVAQRFASHSTGRWLRCSRCRSCRSTGDASAREGRDRTCDARPRYAWQQMKQKALGGEIRYQQALATLRWRPDRTRKGERRYDIHQIVVRSPGHFFDPSRYRKQARIRNRAADEAARLYCTPESRVHRGTRREVIRSHVATLGAEAPVVATRCRAVRGCLRPADRA
jgi:hypothetical protein